MPPTELMQPIPESQRTQVEDIIFRKQTERQKFIKTLQQKQQEHTINHTPFDYRCAKEDYIEEQERLWRRHGPTLADKPENIKVNIDLNKYASTDRLKLLRKTDVRENKLIDGLKQVVITGQWHEYKCKERGCNLSIEVPNRETTQDAQPEQSSERGRPRKK